MRKAIFGGLLFLGGANMYSVACLGSLGGVVQAHYMDIPEILGVLIMIMGFAIGAHGIWR